MKFVLEFNRIKKMTKILILSLLPIMHSCSEQTNSNSKEIAVNKKETTKIFEKITSEHSAIDFSNNLIENVETYENVFNFDYFYADLIDLQSNETVASIESRGYSEGCQPLAGKIYTNTAAMVVNSWQ